MKAPHCHSLFSASLAATGIVIPRKTSLYRSAASILEMAAAYESDGATFFTAGDLVNALASCWYGFGWLHFGLSYGLLCSRSPHPCPFSGSVEPLPPALRGKLVEKATRYGRLLTTARASVVCAPDPSTPGYDFAMQVLCIAETYTRYGELRIQEAYFEDALACFSYGHGWLDAGVKAGLFCIVAERDLFTV